MRHLSLVLVAGILVPGAAGGCNDVDWNWDTSWWKPRRRVVRPSKPSKPSETERAGARDKSLQGDSGANAPRADRNAGDNTRSVRSSSQPAGQRPSRSDRLFYNLYLLSAQAEDTPTDRDTSFIKLHNAGARTCASLLEMLYVPLGRSGSVDECYLIYERPDELAAARDFAPKLDIRPADKNAPVAGPEAPLANGVACFLHILDCGAVVDRAVIALCRRNLAEAAQSSRIAARERWAAAILAARLASEYEYDYAAARSYCDQARRFAEAQSIERMIADWWRADTFMQEGKTPDAVEAYEELIDAHIDRRAGSSIITRSEAILKKLERP